MKKQLFFSLLLMLGLVNFQLMHAQNDVDEYPMDMTHKLANPSFEENQGDKQQTIPGWTKTGANNSEFGTRNDAGPMGGDFKTGNVYFQYWSNANPRPDYSISQIVTDLPDGLYKAYVDAGGDAGTRGTFFYAGDKEVEVTTGGSEYEIEFILTGGSVEIGFKSISRTVNWSFADNFRLSYLGDSPAFVLNVSSLFFDETNVSKNITVNGFNLSEDIEFSAPAGISFSPSKVTPAEALSGQSVTVTWDPAVFGTTLDGQITVSSIDSDSKTIDFVTSKDSECFAQAYPDKNLAPDPFFNDGSKMLGWGARNLLIGSDKAYCGAGVGFSNGGSYDQRILWKGNTPYIVKAMINANGTNVQLGAYGIGKGDFSKRPIDKNNWESVVLEFTTGASPTTSGGVFFNDAGAAGAYIDNLEVYEARIVSFETGDGSPIDPMYVVKDGKLKEPVLILAGYNVTGWYTDSEHTTLWDFDTDVVDSDMTLYAKWEAGLSIVKILTNAGFDASINFKVDDDSTNLGSANGGANIQAVEGWKIGAAGDNSAASTFEYGYAGTLNVSGAYGKIPAAGFEGSVGGALGVSAAWSATVTYTQAVTLEVGGKYGVKYVAYNSGPNAANTSKVGWVPASGNPVLSAKTSFAMGEWTEETVEFVVGDGAEGKIQVGIGSPNSGSGAVGRIFFDWVQLVYYGVEKSGLTAKIADATTLYGDGSGEKATLLSDAITAAGVVEADDDVTQNEVFDAIDALAGVMYTYQLANASADNPMNMTARITNPSFELSNRFEGWVNAGAFAAATSNPGTLGFAKDGTVFIEKYTPPANSLTEAELYQVITGLPNGKYVLTAAAQARVNENGDNPGYAEGAEIFANYKSVVVSEAKNDYTLTISVVDGTLKIGFKVIPEMVNWVCTDNYRLAFIGIDVDDMAEALEALIEEAEEVTGTMQAAIATELAEAITQAEAAVATPTEEDLGDAGARLSAAMNATKASLQAYGSLNAAIESVTGKLGAYDAADKTVINEAVASAQGVYNTATADVEGVEDAVETLQAAFNVFALANADEVPMDMTYKLENPSFEANQGDRQQTIPGWTKVGTTSTEYGTRNDAGPKGGAFKTGNIYFQYWSNANPRPDFSISQIVTELPDGLYKAFVDAGGDAGTTGTFFYAGDKEVEVTTDGSEYEIEFILTGGSVEIGFKSVNRTVNWSFADNFRLVYYGNKMSFDVSKSQLLLTDDALAATFTVFSNSVVNNIELSGPQGLSIIPSTITPEEAANTVTVTVTWDPEVLGSSAGNMITIESVGAVGKTITVSVSDDGSCSTILDPDNNLITDPYFNNPSQLGWGNHEITTEEVFCGLTSGKVWGKQAGSIDRSVTWEPETAYILRAYVNTSGEGFVLGLGKAWVEGQKDHEGYNIIPDTEGEWQLFENSFITGADAGSEDGLIWFNNYASGNNVTGYIDNMELYVAAAVTYDTDGGTEIPVVIVLKGELAEEPTAPEKEGFKFTGWFADANLETAWDFDADLVTENTTIYAGWEEVAGIENLDANDPIVSSRYYTLHGVEIVKPIENGVYIKQSVLQSGKIVVSKEYIKYIK